MRRLRILSALLAALIPCALIAGSGYKVNGTDLDSIFAPYHAGWPQAAATGYKVGGTDLNARYAPLSTGSAAASTGFHISGGADLNAIFAAAGSTSVLVGSGPSSVSGARAAGNPSGTVTSNSTSCSGSKGGGSYSYTWHFSGGAATFTAPSSQSTAVTGTVNAGSTISGGFYCTVSDGITNANSGVASWSLQNTSPAYIFNGSIVAVIYTTDNGIDTSVSAGYQQGLMGSISSGGAMLGGQTIIALSDDDVYSDSDHSYVQRGFNLYISGFSSSPGASFFSTLNVNGTAYTSASAIYQYNSGTAVWSWSSEYPFGNGTTYPVTITP